MLETEILAISEMLRKDFKQDFWKGTVPERKWAFRKLNAKMNGMFDRATCLRLGEVPDDRSAWTTSEGSTYAHDTDTITMKGKLSLITYLHEYAHAILVRSPTVRPTTAQASLGIAKAYKDYRMELERISQSFAVEIFRKAYPKKYAMLDMSSGIGRRKDDVGGDGACQR
jgi:hypothetical protein